MRIIVHTPRRGGVWGDALEGIAPVSSRVVDGACAEGILPVGSAKLEGPEGTCAG